MEVGVGGKWETTNHIAVALVSTVRRGIARSFCVKGSGTHSMHMYDTKYNCKMVRLYYTYQC